MQGWIRASACLLFSIAVTLAQSAFGQQPDLDPNALAVLKQTANSITGAKNFSFKVLISRDRIATDNQIVTYFNLDTVTVARPDKLRIDVDGEHHNVQFFFNGKEATLFDAEQKFYTTHAGADTIEGMLQNLEKRGVSFPMSDLLNSNPYDSFIHGLKTAYVVGRVDIEGKTFVHLVFTEGTADWQLWVSPGDKPLPRAMTIIYKTLPGSPRISMDFRDWDLNAQPASDLFDFTKPSDAHPIEFLAPHEGRQQ